MGMPNQIHEAARQIIENASDIHGALALCGRQDLMGKVISIQKKAACIIRMERPEVNPLEGCRHDVMNAFSCLEHVITRNQEHWPDIDGEELVTIIRMAEICVKRGHAYLDKVVAVETEGYLKNTTEGDDDDECA